MKTFTITSEHLKLIRRMNVGWQDCETGAPEIDPKRPYGNSSVDCDVAEILGLDIDWDRDDVISDQTREYCEMLHKQTEDALQIVLATGKFEVGTFEREDYSSNWKVSA